MNQNFGHSVNSVENSQDFQGQTPDLIYRSNSLRGRPLCRIIDWRVPIRISRCMGIGTVIVVKPAMCCITTWLPRWRTAVKPCCPRIRHRSAPENTPQLRHKRPRTGSQKPHYGGGSQPLLGWRIQGIVRRPRGGLPSHFQRSCLGWPRPARGKGRHIRLLLFRVRL